VTGLAALLSMVGVAEAHDCSCKANGRDYEQGQVVCVLGKLAECSMQLNNSSWKITSESCPEASLRPYPAASSPLPLLQSQPLPSC
jgi:hypothetical protein